MNRKDFHTQLAIKVFDLGNKRATNRTIKPKPGHHWNDAGVDEILDAIANDLEKRFPTEDFRMIQVGRGAYNFIHAGERVEEIEAAKLALKGGTVSVDGVELGDVEKAIITFEGGS